HPLGRLSAVRGSFSLLLDMLRAECPNSRTNKDRRVLEVLSVNTVVGDIQWALTVVQPATHILCVIDGLLVCKVLDPVVPDHVKEYRFITWSGLHRSRLHA